MPAWAALTRQLKLLLPVSALAAAALFTVTELTYQESTSSLDSLASRGVARTAIQTVLRRLLDAETAQRGYLLTGRKEYLSPYEDAARDIAEAIGRLQAHYRGDDSLQGIVRTLQRQVEEKESELAATLDLYNGGSHERWRDLLMTNIGRERMEAVRSTAEVLLAAEDHNVALERASIFGTLSLSRAIVYLLTVLGLLALAFYVRKTAALEAAQARHAEDLQNERDALERQVERRTAELTELASHLQTAREDERNHLARELHDELGALLTAAKLDVARLKRGLGVPTPELEQRVQHLNGLIDQGISLKRSIIENLRPSSLSNLGLVAALDIQAREFTTRAGIPVHTQLEPVQLSEPAQMTVYRLVQESLTNITKYAAARSVTVSLLAELGRVRVAVEDDGSGFDPGQVAPTSHGLTGMRYRVASAGGEMRVVSAPGRGTMIEAWLPETVPVAVSDRQGAASA
jgi:signal transduction histidine kinase